jgi:hypothetical protein
MSKFDSIQNKTQLLEVIKQIHFACYKLCKQSLGKYPPNAGNIGIFCHDDDEYAILIKMREELTEPSDSPNQKYYRLLEPIIVLAKDDIPETIYTHIYIRKPDPTPYGQHTGDIDFVLNNSEYIELKQSLKNGVAIKGARIYDHPAQDMIELYDSDIDALGYISTEKTTKDIRARLNINTIPS